MIETGPKIAMCRGRRSRALVPNGFFGRMRRREDTDRGRSVHRTHRLTDAASDAVLLDDLRRAHRFDGSFHCDLFVGKFDGLGRGRTELLADDARLPLVPRDTAVFIDARESEHGFLFFHEGKVRDGAGWTDLSAVIAGIFTVTGAGHQPRSPEPGEAGFETGRSQAGGGTDAHAFRATDATREEFSFGGDSGGADHPGILIGRGFQERADHEAGDRSREETASCQSDVSFRIQERFVSFGGGRVTNGVLGAFRSAFHAEQAFGGLGGSAGTGYGARWTFDGTPPAFGTKVGIHETAIAGLGGEKAEECSERADETAPGAGTKEGEKKHEEEEGCDKEGVVKGKRFLEKKPSSKEFIGEGERATGQGIFVKEEEEVVETGKKDVGCGTDEEGERIEPTGETDSEGGGEENEGEDEELEGAWERVGIETLRAAQAADTKEAAKRGVPKVEEGSDGAGPPAEDAARDKSREDEQEGGKEERDDSSGEKGRQSEKR